MSDAQELLEVAVQAARGAGGLLLQRVREGAEREVASKSTPTDLVSAADLAAESAIRGLLRERRPNDGLVGEEGDSEEGTSGLSWVVDPLDGTINFLFGIPQWCVSVAVRDERGTVAGAIYDPNRDELFTATRDDGPALMLSAGDTLELHGSQLARTARSDGEEAAREPVGDLASAMVATGLAYDADVRAAQSLVLARVAPQVRDIRRFGSAALDLAWTAAGRFDAYFERGVKEWDIAAGALICERAGLAVGELAQRGILPWGVLAGRAELVEQLRAMVDAE